MTDIYFDSPCSDADRRIALYNGDIFVYSPTETTAKLCALAKQLISEAFAPNDPRTVDRYLSVEECARILATLKPAFIHHPECKQLLPKIIGSIGGIRMPFISTCRGCVLRTLWAISLRGLHMLFIRIAILGTLRRCVK